MSSSDGRIFSEKFDFDMITKNSAEGRSSGSYADPFSRALDTNKASSDSPPDGSIGLWRGLLQDQVATLTREVDSLRSVNSQNEARMAQVMQFLEKHQHALALEPKERQRCLETAMEHIAHERTAREQQIRGAFSELREGFNEQRTELRQMVADMCQQEREQTKTMVARARQILDSDESLRQRLQSLLETEMITKDEFKGEFQRLEKLSHDLSVAYTEESFRKGEAISRCEEEIRQVASHFEVETRRFSEALEKVTERLSVRRAVPDNRLTTICSRSKSPEQTKPLAATQLASDARTTSPLKRVIVSSPSKRQGSTSPLRARAASPVPRTSAIAAQATGRHASPVKQGSPVRHASPIRPASPVRALSPSGGLLLGASRSWAFGNPQPKVSAVAPLLSGKQGLAGMSPRSLTVLTPRVLPTNTAISPDANAGKCG